MSMVCVDTRNVVRKLRARTLVSYMFVYLLWYRSTLRFYNHLVSIVSSGPKIILATMLRVHVSDTKL